MVRVGGAPRGALAGFTLLVAFLASGFSVGAARVDLEPDPALASLGALGDPLPLERYVEGAFAVSGGDAAESVRARTALERGLAAWKVQAASLGDERERAEAALDFLHERYFRRYEENQTRVDLALLEGSYNCVSSAVLYIIFAKAAGLQTGGVVSSDHAFVFVRVDGRAVDVETTNPHGFEPGTRKEFTDSFGRATGYSYVPPTAYARRRSIGDRETLALVLSNRITMLEREGRWSEGLALGADYDALLRSAEARGFLLDRVSNLVADLENRALRDQSRAVVDQAIASLGREPRLAELSLVISLNQLAELGAKGRWDEGWELAVALTGSAPPDPRLAEFLRVATHNAILALTQAARWTEAVELVAARAPRLGAADLAAYRSTIAESRLGRAVKLKPLAAALAEVDAVAAWNFLSSARIREAAVYLYVAEANRLAGESGYLAAADALEPALARYPGESGLSLARSTFLRNAAIEIHNRFATLFNQGRYAEARAAVEAGLKTMPGERILSDDLRALEKAGK